MTVQEATTARQRRKLSARPKTYKLGSNSLVYSPGVIRWAMANYRSTSHREDMVRLVADGWTLPQDAAVALLSGAAPFTVSDDVVEFTHTPSTEPKQ